MKYRDADVQRLIDTFIEKIDELVECWTAERDEYLAAYHAARGREEELRRQLAQLKK